MKESYKGAGICSFIFLLLSVIHGCKPAAEPPNGLSFVDPYIGGVGHLLKSTRPTAHLPNQIVRMSPVRKDYLDDQIRGFQLSQESFNVMPYTGTLGAATPVSSWDKQLEKSTPYYFSTWLEDYDITAEFSPGKKSGYFRFTFPDDESKHLFLNLNKSDRIAMTDNNGIIIGKSSGGINSFIYGEFNEKPVLNDTANTRISGRYFTWSDLTDNVIEFKYAISLISTENARKSLKEEIPGWSFESTRDSARSVWEKVFKQIEVKGGTDQQKRSFYTALYRCNNRMIDISEDGEYQSYYDSAIHKSERRFYVDDGIWDTYLALHPLRTILNPELEEDMVQSYVNMYQQSGWMPMFPSIGGDRAVMNGFHSTIMILDAYRKGLRNFDIEKAYEGMKKNALEATMLPWENGPACILDSIYWERGYYPALRPGEKETVPMVHSFERRQAVAITLGHCYDDWALAQMAKELGKTDDYEFFMKRSKNYKNAWWSEKGFFMPKDINGKWIDIDPKFDGGQGGRDYYDENNGWTYLWQVQHDLPGLVELMGGERGFENRLDQLFRESLGRSKYELYAKFPDFTGIVGQFSMGNEPSFHIPYLYNLTGSPWKTQKRVRMLLDTWYMDNIFGIPGDEDGGGMSAFVVFSSMGFYPLIPGLPLYTITSPIFEEVKINLPNGKTFTVKASGGTEKNIYISRAWLNGKPLEIPWITNEDIMNGGVLKLQMVSYPDRKWGNGEDKLSYISREW
jgi:predicted alpha-1,2-mannosidase